MKTNKYSISTNSSKLYPKEHSNRFNNDMPVAHDGGQNGFGYGDYLAAKEASEKLDVENCKDLVVLGALRQNKILICGETNKQRYKMNTSLQMNKIMGGYYPFILLFYEMI